MNHSGKAVFALSDEFKVDFNNDVLVVYDDFHLDLGQIRYRPNGSDAGHNGIKSIQYELQSASFPRCRIGIGPFQGNDLVDFVLGEFSNEEELMIPDIFEMCTESIFHWIEHDIQSTMNKFNAKRITKA
jgi:PTH1 family peptidyl-tRNA hydrolase